MVRARSDIIRRPVSRCDRDLAGTKAVLHRHGTQRHGHDAPHRLPPEQDAGEVGADFGDSGGEQGAGGDGAGPVGSGHPHPSGQPGGRPEDHGQGRPGGHSCSSIGRTATGPSSTALNAVWLTNPRTMNPVPASAATPVVRAAAPLANAPASHTTTTWDRYIHGRGRWPASSARTPSITAAARHPANPPKPGGRSGAPALQPPASRSHPAACQPTQPGRRPSGPHRQHGHMMQGQRAHRQPVCGRRRKPTARATVPGVPFAA